MPTFPISSLGRCWFPTFLPHRAGQRVGTKEYSLNLVAVLKYPQRKSHHWNLGGWKGLEEGPVPSVKLHWPNILWEIEKLHIAYF